MGEKDIAREGAREVVIGSITGALGKLIEFPCDTIKVRLQYSQSLPQPLFNGTFDAIKKTYKREGILNGFYKGLRVPLMGASAEMSCLFFSYNLAQDLARLHKGIPLDSELKVLDKLICGGFSGLCTSFILTPIELVKCKFQVENLKNMDNPNFKPKTIPIIMRETFKEKGIKGLWRGHTFTMIREFGGGMAWFGNYEFIISTFANGQPKYEPKAHELMIAGAMAGIGYHCTMFPADTVKSILQTNERNDLTFLKVIKHIYKTKGILGFYSGIGVTLTKSIPTSAIMFLSYEKLKQFIVF